MTTEHLCLGELSEVF